MVKDLGLLIQLKINLRTNNNLETATRLKV